MQKTRQKTLKFYPGFTLIELMIVIAIVAVLATIAVPSYQNYTKKAAVSELIQASSAYKAEVELCIYNTSSADNCSSGKNGIQAKPSNLDNFKYLQNISVDAGKIAVTGKGSLEKISYTMTPTLQGETISWSIACTGDSGIFPAGFCTTAANEGS